MKKRKKNTGHRFKITAYRPPSRTALSEMEPEELAVYVRRAEKRALPTIKEMRLGPGAAQLLLAQHAQVLATGDPQLTAESITAVANQVMTLWQAGYYTPGPDYPYTFEETLQELREGERERKTTLPISRRITLQLGKTSTRHRRSIGGNRQTS